MSALSSDRTAVIQFNLSFHCSQSEQRTSHYPRPQPQNLSLSASQPDLCNFPIHLFRNLEIPNSSSRNLCRGKVYLPPPKSHFPLGPFGGESDSGDYIDFDLFARPHTKSNEILNPPPRKPRKPPLHSLSLSCIFPQFLHFLSLSSSGQSHHITFQVIFPRVNETPSCFPH